MSAAQAANPTKFSRRRLFSMLLSSDSTGPIQFENRSYVSRAQLCTAPPHGHQPPMKPANGSGTSPPFLELPLDVVERGVAHILAVDHVDHVLADVLGVIADTLQGTHHPENVQRATNGARVFHHEGDALALDRLVFLI